MVLLLMHACVYCKYIQLALFLFGFQSRCVWVLSFRFVPRLGIQGPMKSAHALSVSFLSLDFFLFFKTLKTSNFRSICLTYRDIKLFFRLQVRCQRQNTQTCAAFVATVICCYEA